MINAGDIPPSAPRPEMASRASEPRAETAVNHMEFYRPSAELKRTHAKLVTLLGTDRAECVEAAAVVEHLRQMWRPSQPRIVLLAESHVWTLAHEARSIVLQPDGVQTGFARFVYCLGASEPKLVSPRVHPNKAGYQYWKLLHDCVRGPDEPHIGLLRSTNAKRRVENKLQLLKDARDAGIWLVDASISALYRPSEEGRSSTRVVRGKKAYGKVLQTCWDNYVGPVMRAAAPPIVLVIGKGVEDAVGELLRRDLGEAVRVEVVKQPNTPMSVAELEEYRGRIFTVCRR